MVIDALDPKKLSFTQYLILAMCCLAQMMDGFATVIIAYTAPAISRDWQVSSEQLGLVFSAGLLGMTIGAMAISSLADVYGRRIVASLSLALIGASSVAIFFAESVSALIVMRILTGIGIGTLMAVIPTLAGEYSPQASRNMIIAIVVVSTSIGSVLGGLVSAQFIADHGWRTLYLYSGALTLGCALVFHVLTPESIAYLASRKTNNTLARINKILARLGRPPLDSLPEETGQAQEKANVGSLLAPGRRGKTLLAWATFFIGYAGMYFIVTWLPKLLVNSGVPEAESIQSVVILTIGSIGGGIFVGWASRWWQLNYLIAGSFTISAALIVLFAFILNGEGQASVWLCWTLSLLIGITLLGAFGNLYTIAMSIYPDSIKATGLGWCTGLGRGGGVLSPSIAGLLLGLGLTSPAVLALSAVTVMLAALGTFLIKK
jgi:MFS transporter, AAHS family, vanillate permease